MTNICAEGGLEAKFLYNGEPYSLDETTEMYSIKASDWGSGLDDEANCPKLAEYIKFNNKIITECPNHAKEIEKIYYEAKLNYAYYCGKDSATGKTCKETIGDKMEDFEKLYSQWEPYQCEHLSSSCYTEVDKILREYAKSPACGSIWRCGEYGSRAACVCKDFKSNPIKSCGKKDYVDSGASSVTTLNGQIVLLSLIMCLVFALFK